MRPYLLLTAVILVSLAAVAQQPFPRSAGATCFYGCDPYVPMLTTPSISLQTISPNPVGASNATTGLIAGATNATLSEIQGSTSSDYTAAIWYQGGAPLTSSEVHVWPEPIGHQRHMMRDIVVEEREQEHHGREQQRAGWTYFTASEHTEDAEQASSTSKTSRKAAHVYTNDDVNRQNDKNGMVKYDGKTEKM